MYADPFRNYACEIENVPYNGIETLLITEGLITSDDQQKISNITLTDNARQRLFRDIVLKYNLEECKKFLECLKRIENYANYEKLYKKLWKALGKYYLAMHMCLATYVYVRVRIYICMVSCMVVSAKMYCYVMEVPSGTWIRMQYNLA